MSKTSILQADNLDRVKGYSDRLPACTQRFGLSFGPLTKVMPLSFQLQCKSTQQLQLFIVYLRKTLTKYIHIID